MGQHGHQRYKPTSFSKHKQPDLPRLQILGTLMFPKNDLDPRPIPNFQFLFQRAVLETQDLVTSWQSIGVLQIMPSVTSPPPCCCLGKAVQTTRQRMWLCARKTIYRRHEHVNCMWLSAVHLKHTVDSWAAQSWGGAGQPREHTPWASLSAPFSRAPGERR